MNKHFSVINKKGVATAGILLFINIVLFSLSLAQLISGGSKLWLAGIIIFAVFFLISIMILVSILTAGIDVKNGTVIMPDLDASKGKQPKFHIDELADVQLEDGKEQVLDPYKDNLVGARIVFTLQDGRREIYYPVQITAKQFETIRSGMLEKALY